MRSIVVMAAITFGLIGGVLSIGIMQGWVAQRVNDAIKNEVSHIQIHQSNYLDNDEIKYIITDFQELSDSLNENPLLAAWSSRVKTSAMVQSSWASTGLSLYGIVPEKEKKISAIHACLIAGEYLQEGTSTPEILISKKTAEALKLRNYTVSEDKKEALLNAGVPVEIFQKLRPLMGERFRTEKEFKAAFSELLNENEVFEYETALFKAFEFYRLRSKVNITTQSLAGDIVYETFRVTGIYKTNNSGFDGATAFTGKSSLGSIIGLEKNASHEIAIVLSNPDDLEAVSKSLRKLNEDITVYNWKEMRPDLAMSTDFIEVMYLVYIGIILFALAFGIINTMLMAVLERVHEIGMLLAIGMNKRRVFYLIMLETLFLSVVGAVLGMIFGMGIVEIFSIRGIDFGMWAEGFEAIGYSAVVYPFVTADVYIGISVLVFITGVIASIWPARRALKLNPAEAVRSDV